MIRKVKPGDKFRPSAKVYNEMADACNKVNHGTASQREYTATAKPHALTVRAANKSAQNLNVGDVCWMESFVPGDFTSDLNLPKCGAYVNIYTGEETSGCLAVVTESIPVRNVGRVAISGLVECSFDDERIATTQFSDRFKFYDSLSPVPNEKKMIPDIGGWCPVVPLPTIQVSAQTIDANSNGRAVVLLNGNAKKTTLQNIPEKGTRGCETGIARFVNPFHFEENTPAQYEIIRGISDVIAESQDDNKIPVVATMGNHLHMILEDLPVHKGECFGRVEKNSRYDESWCWRIYVCQKDIDESDPSIVIQNREDGKGWIPVRNILENVGALPLTDTELNDVVEYSDMPGPWVFTLDEESKTMKLNYDLFDMGDSPKGECYSACRNEYGVWETITPRIVTGTWDNWELVRGNFRMHVRGVASEEPPNSSMKYDIYHGDTISAMWPSGELVRAPMDFAPGTVLAFGAVSDDAIPRGWELYYTIGGESNPPTRTLYGTNTCVLLSSTGMLNTDDITSYQASNGVSVYPLPEIRYYIKVASPDM